MDNMSNNWIVLDNGAEKVKYGFANGDMQTQYNCTAQRTKHMYICLQCLGNYLNITTCVGKFSQVTK